MIEDWGMLKKSDARMVAYEEKERPGDGRVPSKRATRGRSRTGKKSDPGTVAYREKRRPGDGRGPGNQDGHGPRT